MKRRSGSTCETRLDRRPHQHTRGTGTPTATEPWFCAPTSIPSDPSPSVLSPSALQCRHRQQHARRGCDMGIPVAGVDIFASSAGGVSWVLPANKPPRWLEFTMRAGSMTRGVRCTYASLRFSSRGATFAAGREPQDASDIRGRGGSLGLLVIRRDDHGVPGGRVSKGARCNLRTAYRPAAR